MFMASIFSVNKSLNFSPELDLAQRLPSVNKADPLVGGCQLCAHAAWKAGYLSSGSMSTSKLELAYSWVAQLMGKPGSIHQSPRGTTAWDYWLWM